jgi:hypothetical protein
MDKESDCGRSGDDRIESIEGRMSLSRIGVIKGGPPAQRQPSAFVFFFPVLAPLRPQYAAVCPSRSEGHVVLF